MPVENSSTLMTEFMTFNLKKAQESLGAVQSPLSNNCVFSDLTPPGNIQGPSVLPALWWGRPVSAQEEAEIWTPALVA